MNGTDWLELVGILLLVSAVALLSAAEVTITRTGRARAYRLAEEGRPGAKSLEKIVENVPPHLNVVLLLTLVCTIGGTTLATMFVARHVDRWAELVSTVGMTLLLFIFAEVTPKTFAVQNTDRVALRLAPIIVWITRAVGPAARLLVSVANVVMPGRGIPEGPFATEQEIRAMAEVASEEDTIEEEEKELIHSIFEFGDTLVREVMVPRPDMVTAPVTATLPDVLDLIVRHGYSRIPIYKETADDLVGVAYAKDLLRHLHAGKADAALENVMRQPYFVPDSKKVSDLLREMQQRRVHIAIVSDEYGSTAGLVTIEDLLEEIVGEIADEYDREEQEITQLGEGRYRVNGRASIDDVNELLDVELPQDEWDTVAGLFFSLLGAVPTQGETVRYGDLEFTAQRVQGRRIATVLITRRPHEPSATAAPDSSGAAAGAE